MNEYDFDIVYKPGKTMVAADVLSRMYDKPKSHEVIIANIKLATEGICSINKVLESQNRTEFADLKNKLAQGSFKGYFSKDNLILKKIQDTEVYVIDHDLTVEIIKHLHEYFGHMGSRKCFLMFREAFISKNDMKTIKLTIRSCLHCQLFKHRNYTHKTPLGHIETKKPLDIVAIDFLCNLPCTDNKLKHILVMYDIFSKYVMLFPTRKTNTKNVIMGLEALFADVKGRPNIILSDNATCFQNQRYKSYLNKQGIKAYFTSIRRPNSNPAERSIEEILKYLRILISKDHRRWIDLIPQVQDIINNTPNTVHEYSPISIMKGINPTRDLWMSSDTIQLEELYSKVKLKCQSKHTKKLLKQAIDNKSVKKYNINDIVLVKALKTSNKKLNQYFKFKPYFQGPYKITDVFNNTYELADVETNRICGKYHVSQIYDYITES